MRFTGLLCSVVIALGVLMIAPAPAHASVAVGIAIRIGPPPLPVYAQPLCPGPGYLWTPGYWAYGAAGYYWVPGTWVLPPEPGLLWTPGYWAFNDGVYLWNAGYWGPTVGFYGGIDYGFGYPGVGFFGGYWSGRTFFYNRAVAHIDFHVMNHYYDRAVPHHYSRFDRVSFNGGRHGVPARPTAREEAAMREHHFQMTGEQMRLVEAARSDRSLRASENHGRPAVAATQRPAEFRANSFAAKPRVQVHPGQHAARFTRPAERNNSARQRAQSRNLQARQQASRNRAQFRNLQARQQMSRQRSANRQQRAFQQARQRQFQQMQRRPQQRSMRFQQRQPRQMQRGGRPQARAEQRGGGGPHSHRPR